MCDHRVLRPIRLQDLYSVCSLATEVAPLLVIVLQLPGCNWSIVCYKNFSAVQDIQREHDLLTGPLPWTTHGLLLYHQVWLLQPWQLEGRGRQAIPFQASRAAENTSFTGYLPPIPKSLGAWRQDLPSPVWMASSAQEDNLPVRHVTPLPQLFQYAAARQAFNSTLFCATTTGLGEVRSRVSAHAYHMLGWGLSMHASRRCDVCGTKMK